jgi:hypothetical protein
MIENLGHIFRIAVDLTVKETKKGGEFGLSFLQLLIYYHICLESYTRHDEA